MSIWRHSPRVAIVLLLVAGCTRGGDDEIASVSGPSTSVASSASSSTAPGSTVPSSTDVSSTAPTSTSTPGGSTSAPSGVTTTTTAAGGATTLAPTTTVRATTTTRPAPTTTTVPATTTTTTIGPLRPEALVLRSDGIGPLAFGVADAELVNRLAEALGAPASDELIDYPVPFEGQFATDEFGDEVFAHPVGRETCYGNGLCAYAGGPSSGALTFVGWSFVGDAPPALVTPSGVTVDSRWADFPTMTVDEGGCYSLGTGSIDGIPLAIESEGALFGEFDEDGNYTPGRPDPADAVVVSLEAGTPPRFPFLDC